MSDPKIPDRCPSCGLDGSLFIRGNEIVCSDPDCGRAYPIPSTVGPANKTKSKSKKKKPK